MNSAMAALDFQLNKCIYDRKIFYYPIHHLHAAKAGGILKKQKGKHALCNIDNRERQLFVEWVKASQKLVSNC